MMKDNIENKAKKAIDLVQGVDDEFKTAAFSVIFDRILDDDENEIQTKKENHANSSKSNDDSISDIQKKKENFADQCGINITELDDVLYFADDIIKVVAPLSGNEPEKQLTVAKCVLTAYDIIYGQSWVKAMKLSKCVGASKVGQLSHLSKNLKKDKQSIRLQGKLKSTQYKITEYGKAQTFDIIKKLAKGEEQ